MFATPKQLWCRRQRIQPDDDESASEEELQDLDVVVGPNPSAAVRQIMGEQFREMAEGLPTAPHTEGLRARAMQGPLSDRKTVAMSDCQILSHLSKGTHPRSFGTTLHLGQNCTILCQVCSFSGTARACKKAWLCDFCHGLSMQCRNKRKGSGAWQVSQMSSQRIIELYEALRASVQLGPDTEVIALPAHPRTIAEPHSRRQWRMELHPPPVAVRSHTWGEEGHGYRASRQRPVAARSCFQPRERDLPAPRAPRSLTSGQNVQQETPWFPVSPNVNEEIRQEMLLRMQRLNMRQMPQPQHFDLPQQSWNQMPQPVLGPPPQSQASIWPESERSHRTASTLGAAVRGFGAPVPMPVTQESSSWFGAVHFDSTTPFML